MKGELITEKPIDNITEIMFAEGLLFGLKNAKVEWTDKELEMIAIIKNERKEMKNAS